MNRTTHAHDPFDLDDWLESVDGRTVELTTFDEEDQYRPDVLESRGAAPALHPPEPKRCEDCGVDVMPLSDSRARAGGCPQCSWSPGPD